MKITLAKTLKRIGPSEAGVEVRIEEDVAEGEVDNPSIEPLFSVSNVTN